VIEKSEDIGGRVITNYVKFQCVQDKTAMPDRFNLGDDVKVQFNIKGTKWVKDGRENYITNLDAWRMETVKMDQGGNAGFLIIMTCRLRQMLLMTFLLVFS
jgi:hypothetical protein